MNVITILEAQFMDSCTCGDPRLGLHPLGIGEPSGNVIQPVLALSLQTRPKDPTGI